MDLYFAGFLILLTGLSRLTALTPEECKASSNTCQAKLLQALQQGNQTISFICSLARSSYVCVRDLQCESEMYLRIAIRTGQARLADHDFHGCEPGLFFPKDKEVSIECQQKKETCMNSYIDVLQQHDTNTTATSLLCQDLNAFASCMLKLDACGVKKDEMTKFANVEKIRLNTPECNVEALNSGAQIAFSNTLWLSAVILAILHWWH